MKSSVMIGGTSDSFARREMDYYPTPYEVTQSLIDTGVIPPSAKIWEPACGEGHMAEVFLKNKYQVFSSDIRDTGYGSCRDFLTGTGPEVDTIITNPPFIQSTEFIERCIELEAPRFAMLLKSQYWHSVRRASLFAKHPPAFIYALTWRPDFCFGERGNSPTMDMLWTVWITGMTDTRYRVLRKPANIPAIKLQ